MNSQILKNRKIKISKELSKVAMGKIKATCVITGAILINTITREKYAADIAIYKDFIACVGEVHHTIGEQTHIIDGSGMFASPAFMDGHVHTESSMLTAVEYAKTVVPMGTGAIFADPHELANVLGIKGVEEYALDGESTPLKVFVTLPSCVPSNALFETSGAVITPAEVAKNIKKDCYVALGEFMNYPAVINGEDSAAEMISATAESGKVVTGHFTTADLNNQLNAYVAGGVRCCHESTTVKEALAKLRLGQYVQLREGSASKDLADTIKIITKVKVNSRFITFVTDDAHIDTLLTNGHMNYLLKKAVSLGMNPIEAIEAVTINTAHCFNLDDCLGSITPGKLADIVLLNNLKEFKAEKVILNGKLVAEKGNLVTENGNLVAEKGNLVAEKGNLVTENGNLVAENGKLVAKNGKFSDANDKLEAENNKSTSEFKEFRYSARAYNTVKFGREITAQDFSVLNIEKIKYIQLFDGKILTELKELQLLGATVTESFKKLKINKAAVFNRHGAKSNFAVGFVGGLGISGGAIATTVAHDCHNLIVVGDNDDDMAFAANALISCGGGQAVISDRKIISILPLQIAGIISDKSATEVAEKLAELEKAAKRLGTEFASPFMTLSFLALPVIPQVRLTDLGLVDTVNFTFIK